MRIGKKWELAPEEIAQSVYLTALISP